MGFYPGDKVTESREIKLEEAIKAVIDIGLRYEKQLELAEAAAKADRQRKIFGKAPESDPGR